MYFPNQQYESIVPEKSGLNRCSVSHFPQMLQKIYRYQFKVNAMCLTDIILNSTERNSVKKNSIVSTVK